MYITALRLYAEEASEINPIPGRLIDCVKMDFTTMLWAP